MSKTRLVQYIIISGIIFLFLFLFPATTQATRQFADNFDDGDISNWTVVPDPNTTHCSAPWTPQNGRVEISINEFFCTTNLMPNDSIWNGIGENYEFELDMTFVDGTDHNVAFRFTPSTPTNDWYDFHFTSPSKVYLERVPASSSSNSKTLSVPNKLAPYHLKIIVKTGRIKLYLDDALVMDYIYEKSNEIFKTGRIALRAGTGADRISKTYFDNVVVREIEGDPVVILPGLFGSWCQEAIFFGKECSGKWGPVFEPFDPYDSLIYSIQHATDIDETYVWYYDWRKPMADLADELDEYITNTVLAGKSDYTKVRLVGHSYGGLVSSHWAIDHLDKVEKVITVGSPHQGAVKAYSVWQAGTVWDGHVALRAIMHMLLSARRGDFASDMDVIRTEFKSIKDVLPIFDYLKDQAGNVISESSMKQRNTNLASQFTNLANIKDFLITIVGIEQNANKDTLEYITVREADEGVSLGWWEDGQPVNYEHSVDGDLTVLKKSAKYNDAVSKPEINTDHKELVTETVGIDAILDALDSTGSAVLSDLIISEDIGHAIFMIRSPAAIEVEIGGALYRDSDNDGIIVIENVTQSQAKVTLKGTGNGDFDLDLIQLHSNGDQSNTYSGAIHENEVLVYLFNLNPEDPETQPNINTDVTAIGSESGSGSDSGNGDEIVRPAKPDPALPDNPYMKVRNLHAEEGIKGVKSINGINDIEDFAITDCRKIRFWVGVLKGVLGLKFNVWLELFRLFFEILIIK